MIISRKKFLNNLLANNRMRFEIAEAMNLSGNATKEDVVEGFKSLFGPERTGGILVEIEICPVCENSRDIDDPNDRLVHDEDCPVK